MELWDLYDKYRNKTGETHIRGEKIPKGRYHLVVHVWIRNSKGEYMISQRAANRPTYPLMWECVGGSVTKGENSIQGALREVREEVGLELSPDQGRILFTKIRNAYNGKSYNDIFDVWLFEYDGEVKLEEATTDEVAQCRWMTKDEIKELYNAGKFVPSLDYFFCAFDNKTPDYSNIIGSRVRGKIDRPIGCRHPKHSDMVYPINYGYVEEIYAQDGDEQDVYVFGTNEPLEKYEGTVIAIYHRFNDVEDKWIVSLDGLNISDDKIIGDISFQEQYFYGKLYR